MILTLDKSIKNKLVPPENIFHIQEPSLDIVIFFKASPKGLPRAGDVGLVKILSVKNHW